MWLFTIFLGGLAIFFFLLYRKRTKSIGILKSLGIPGPEPHWFWGNTREIDPMNMNKFYQEWTKKCGKVFGFYEGPVPIIVSADPEFLKNVFIKEFSNFHGRKPFPVQSNPEDASQGVHMFSARGHRWKRLRTIINPTFTSIKLKRMINVVNKKVGILLEKLDSAASQEKPFNVQTYYEGLTLDVIGEAAFGMDVDPQNDPTEPFLVRCRQVFTRLQKRPFIFTIATLFPELRYMFWNVFLFLGKVTDSPERWLINSIEKVVAMRKQGEGKHPDMLQLMLDAEADTSSTGEKASLTMTVSEEDSSEANNTELTFKGGKNKGGGLLELDNNYKTTGQRKLTIDEIKMQGFLFMIAGYETTSTTLTYCSYLLATNPEKQLLLQEEVDQHLTPGEEPTYEKLQEMPYLEMVLTETLRMYPLGSLVVNRLCMETCNVEGYTIPEGCVVQADVWSLHYNADLWGPEDTNKFEPERCSKERMKTRHPMAWIPFGAGPRNCIGLRFAYMEAKVALARIVRQFEFVQCKETQVPLELQEVGVMQPKNGVTVVLKKRQ